MVQLGHKELSGLLGLRVLRAFLVILVQLGLRVLLARMVLTGIKVFRVKLGCRVKPA
jgi:hypothetical protein